jgi:hypothetical protein
MFVREPVFVIVFVSLRHDFTVANKADELEEFEELMTGGEVGN